MSSSSSSALISSQDFLDSLSVLVINPSRGVALVGKDTRPAILRMTREQIYQGALTPDLLGPYLDLIMAEIRESQITVNLGNGAAWAAGPGLLEPKTIKQLLKPLPTPLFWNPEGQKSKIKQKVESDQIDVLVAMYRFYLLCLENRKDHPTTQVFLKFMDCLIERIAIAKGKQNDSHFSIDLPHTKTLLCFKTPSGWACGNYDAVKKVSEKIVNINTTKTQVLFFDQDKQLVGHPCIIISTQFHSETDLEASAIALATQAKIPSGRLFTKYVNQYVQTTRGKILKANFCFYRGATLPFNLQNNAITYTADIDLRKASHALLGLKQDANLIVKREDLPTGKQDKFFREKIGQIFSVYQKSLIEPFQKKKNLDARVTYQIDPPQTHGDKLQVLLGLLQEFAKDPKENAQEIFYLAELMDFSLTQEEADALIASGKAKKEDDESIALSPSFVVKELITDATEKLLLCAAPSSSAPALPAPPADTETPTPAAVPGSQEATEPVEKTPEDEKDNKMGQASADAEKAMRRKRHLKRQKWERYHQQRRASVASASAPTGDATPASAATPLTSGEKTAVRSIYEGQPLKAKKFTEFAKSIISKKARESGASISSKTKGSHPKLHLKRKEGASGGVTLKIHHGKKDQHGSVKNQKETLDKIFSL